MRSFTETKNILFVGGDRRQIRAINETSKNGNTVSILGFDTDVDGEFEDNVQILGDWSEMETLYDAIILPLPYTMDGRTINAPFSKREIVINEVFDGISKKNKIIAGRCDNKIKTMAESHRIMLIDYICREELAMMNAIPTAEGAIQIAMEETPFTIHSSKCLVIGNGRIGKILSKMLHGIGAKVTVAARKKVDLAYGFAMGLETIAIDRLDDKIGEYDIVFNTAPSLIVDFTLLSKMKNDVLIIDLASKPGGVDFDEARRKGIKVVWALSLPGKVAPDTAGEIISSTIANILDEMGGIE